MFEQFVKEVISHKERTVRETEALIDYVDTDKTTEYRNNLFKINSEYALHWFDLRIKDVEVSKLAARLERDEMTLPIDLSERFLYRIFTHGSFKKGGHFIVVGGRMYQKNIDLTLQSMKILRRNMTTLN